ncbi:MAG: DUF1761 domain-containing protein [Hyphomicrobiaceae bacterium]|nr:DUF1761 domain-containing protein [Hyphomicrobiaceae bacterium]
MNFAGISYLAVALAAAASFMFGGVWYGLLGKQWMAAVGLTEDQVKARSSSGSMLWVFSLTIVAQFVMAFVLAGLIGHLGKGFVTLRNGMISGAFVWLGFVVTTLLVNHSFQGTRPSLTAIDAGHWLGVLLIQGAIIGLIGIN